MSRVLRAAVVLVSIALRVTAVSAQDHGTSAWLVAGPTLLVGEASDFLDGGWGGAAGLAVPLGSWLAFRGEGRFMRLTADRDPGGAANNDVFATTAGLEAELGNGWLRPWAQLSAGLFANRSTATATGRRERHTTWAAGTSVGGGLRVRLSRRLATSAGVDVSRAGSLDYGRYGGSPPDITRVRTRVAFLSVQLGLQLRLGASTR
jgi:opacity protein-like surface antigen